MPRRWTLGRGLTLHPALYTLCARPATFITTTCTSEPDLSLFITSRPREINIYTGRGYVHGQGEFYLSPYKWEWGTIKRTSTMLISRNCEWKTRIYLAACKTISAVQRPCETLFLRLLSPRLRFFEDYSFHVLFFLFFFFWIPSIELLSSNFHQDLMIEVHD